VKHILRYLKGIHDVGLIYKSDTECTPVGYLDSYYVGCNLIYN